VTHALDGRSARSTHEASGYGRRVIGSIDEVVIDCADPARLAAFWAHVLGGQPVERDDAWWYILPPGWTQLSFQKVPEPKIGKNRLHLDVRVHDIEAATAEAEALGARRVGGIHQSEAGAFQVLHDPEGNEWCVVRPTPVR
jgi:predicted enzyme related to lactoylglutathione lyase